MTKSREDAEKTLINATIKSIEKNGLKNTTIRAIANEANVNSSAISYYFRSRDELIKKTMQVTIDNAINMDDVEILENDSYQIVLKKYLTDWLEGARNYPGITKAHFEIIQGGFPLKEELTHRINQYINDLFSILVQHGLADHQENRIKLNIIFGVFIGNNLMPELTCFNLNHSDPEQYIDQLVEFI